MQDSDLRIPRQAATLRSMIEDRLRAAILSGRFKAGQRLVERELCDLFGVGRTSIRESLRHLEAEGLVVIVPHKGPSVSSISYEEAEQLYDVRAMLEGFAGQQFSERGTAKDMDALSQAVEQFADAAETLDPVRMLAAKTDFYNVLMDGCGNIFIRQMLSLLHNRVNLLRSTSMLQPGRVPNSVAEIREIHDAIRARDGIRAAGACRHHIDQAARTVLAYLRNQDAA